MTVLPGVAIGEAAAAIQHVERQLDEPASLTTSF
jgi:hypothetical protein